MCNTIINFTRTVLKEVHIDSRICTFPFEPEDSFDHELRKSIFYLDEDYKRFLQNMSLCFQNLYESYTLCRCTDRFGCEYIFLKLPDASSPSLLLIGPFSYTPFTNNRVLNLCRRIELPEDLWNFMQQYYLSLPVVADGQWMESLIFTLARELWKGQKLSMPHLTDTEKHSQEFPSTVIPPTQNMLSYMEQKYESEDLLMTYISNGDLEMINRLRQHLQLSAIKQRFPDTLRNQKNNLLIFNTVCRKAAQNGGVHPLYLDTESNKLESRIEYAVSLSQLDSLYREIPRKYCMLVCSHSLKDYSPTIRKVIMYISSNLTEDLGLQAISKEFSLNKNYLSTIFQKEVGVSLTNFVNQKRIQHAIYLLNTSQLPIQDIAEACGIRDSNYFSRLFRRQVGMPPSSYRQVKK